MITIGLAALIIGLVVAYIADEPTIRRIGRIVATVGGVVAIVGLVLLLLGAPAG